MPARRFDDLPVWRASLELAVGIFDLGTAGAFRGHPALRDQIERAVISISNNIAEGHERGTKEELLTFLYYARGSAAEVRSMLLFLGCAKEWAGIREEVGPLTSLCLGASRQLGAWIESIKNSEHPDARRENDATRQARHSARRQAAFMDELRRIVRDGRGDSAAPDATTGG